MPDLNTLKVLITAKPRSIVRSWKQIERTSGLQTADDTRVVQAVRGCSSDSAHGFFSHTGRQETQGSMEM